MDVLIVAGAVGWLLVTVSVLFDVPGRVIRRQAARRRAAVLADLESRQEELREALRAHEQVVLDVSYTPEWDDWWELEAPEDSDR